MRDTIIRACEIATKKIGYKDIGFLFICSDENRQDKARLKLFKKWFNVYKKGIGSLNYNFSSVVKEYKDQSFCAGVLLNKDIPVYELQKEDVKKAMNVNLGLDRG